MWLWIVGGAIAGSVANAIIYRIPRKLSWFSGRSICPHCEHPLAWYDLVPLVSFLGLRGRCRCCGKNIGWRYFGVELVMAAGFAYFHSPLMAAMVFFTIVIAAMDWETQLVSDWLVVIWAGIALLVGTSLMSGVIGAVVAVVLIGGIWAISRGRAMGSGDVEIAAVIGLWLGWPRTIYALWLAFVLGGIVAVWLLTKDRAKLKSTIALGPFLILGAWLAFSVNWGNVLPF